MTERILVTGGAGFIGSHLVDALLERGHQVRVYDNLDPQVHGGLRERGEWPAYLSPAAGRSQEEMCLVVGRAYGIPTVALRYFNVCGPCQSSNNPYTGVVTLFAQRLLEGKPPLVCEDGEQTRDLVHVGDVVQANLLALERAPEGALVLNVGSSRPVSIRQVAGLLVQALGREIAPDVPGTYRPGDVRHSWADIGRAQALLGYAPCVPFANGVRGLAGGLTNLERV